MSKTFKSIPAYLYGKTITKTKKEVIITKFSIMTCLKAMGKQVGREKGEKEQKMDASYR